MVKILLIEDETILLELSEHVLSNEGYDIISAADGEAGVALAKSEIPDLIITDMSMPKMTGWEVLEVLKNNPTTRDIPVIALSAHTTADDRAAGFDAGVSAYVEKPVDMARLKKRIAEILDS